MARRESKILEPGEKPSKSALEVRTENGPYLIARLRVVTTAALTSSLEATRIEMLLRSGSELGPAKCTGTQLAKQK